MDGKSGRAPISRRKIKSLGPLRSFSPPPHSRLSPRNKRGVGMMQTGLNVHGGGGWSDSDNNKDGVADPPPRWYNADANSR